jgi:hypothetical protein
VGDIEDIYTRVEAVRTTPDVYTPTAIEARDFLEAFLEIVRDEQKGVYGTEVGLRQERIDAMMHVMVWLQENEECLISHTDPNRLVFQLALRIRRPRIINQGSFGLCGPATMLCVLAKRDPVRYATMVLDLASSGRARWNDDELSLEVGDGGGRQGRAPDADWLPMLALRKKAELVLAGSQSGGLDFNLDDKDSHATTPGQLVELLTRGGWRNARDVTVARRTYSELRSEAQIDVLRRHLGNCSQRLTGHNREIVIMLVHPQVAQNAKYGNRVWGVPTVDMLHKLHWILVKSLDVNVGAGTVRLKISTWRWSQEVQFSLADFIPRYFGYVYAAP